MAKPAVRLNPRRKGPRGGARPARSFRVQLAVKVGRAWRQRIEQRVTAATVGAALSAIIGRSAHLTAASVTVEELHR